MLKSIHVKVDEETFTEWLAIGESWHGVRSKIMRRKIREVIDEVKSNPIYIKEDMKSGRVPTKS